MSTENNLNPAKGVKPSHIVYKTYEVNGKKHYTRIGVAWKHKSGDGLNLVLDSFVIFPNKPQDEKAGA